MEYQTKNPHGIQYTRAICPVPLQPERVQLIKSTPDVYLADRTYTRVHPRKRQDSRARGLAYWQRLVYSPLLNEEEKLLVQLRGVEGLPWKDVQASFNRLRGTDMRQPALQMRMRRLTVRMNRIETTAHCGKGYDSVDCTELRIHPQNGPPRLDTLLGDAFLPTVDLFAESERDPGFRIENCVYPSHILGIDGTNGMACQPWPLFLRNELSRPYVDRNYLLWERRREAFPEDKG